MRKRTISLLALSLLTLPVTFNNCGNPSAKFVTKGTEITNPMNPAATHIVSSICSVIQRCHPEAVVNSCVPGVLSAKGMDAPLGLDSNFDTLSLVSQAENSGLLVGDSTAQAKCSAAIDSLSCADPRVVAAYNSSVSNPYSTAAVMVPAAGCGSVFVSAVEYQCPLKVFLRGVSNAADSPLLVPAGLTFSVSPSLPAGLSLDTATGIISGAPTTAFPMTAFTVSAAGPQGTIATTLNLKGADGFLVNDFGDAADQNPGDGTCATATGVCTLRAALSEAVTGRNDIVLPDGTIKLSSTLLISKSLNIFGGCAAETVVDGQTTTSQFEITQPNTTVSMQRLKIQNGTGGSIMSGFNDGSIFNGSRLTFYNNHSTGTYGAAVTWWGPASEFHCDDCIFDSNQAPTGGTAADPSGATGAVFMVDKSNSFNRCLFVNNSGRQGAVGDNSDIGSSYINTTFFANVGTIGSGGIWVNIAGSNHQIINSTFVNNQGAWGGAVDGGGTIHMSNTILFDNPGSSGDCDRALVSHGGNLSTSTAWRCNFNQPTDLTGAPNLGPLQDNGGYSRTMALLPGSLAIDAGRGTGCPATDQRGLSRPGGQACDIGAFEAR